MIGVCNFLKLTIFWSWLNPRRYYHISYLKTQTSSPITTIGGMLIRGQKKHVNKSNGNGLVVEARLKNTGSETVLKKADSSAHVSVL